jgi:hypothetical protein
MEIMMLRKFMLAAPVAVALSLGGCAGVDTATVISQVQQAAVLACGFLPTAATVANILAAGNPALQVASAVATAICTAVTAKGARRGGAIPNVNGVEVHGKFVQ